MSTRDARGRFVSADVAAAERVLEAAVREAAAILRRGIYRGVVTYGNGIGTARRYQGIERDHVHLATQALTHATHAAELLLSEPTP